MQMRLHARHAVYQWDEPLAVILHMAFEIA